MTERLECKGLVYSLHRGHAHGALRDTARQPPFLASTTSFPVGSSTRCAGAVELARHASLVLPGCLLTCRFAISLLHPAQLRHPTRQPGPLLTLSLCLSHVDRSFGLTPRAASTSAEQLRMLLGQGEAQCCVPREVLVGAFSHGSRALAALCRPCTCLTIQNILGSLSNMCVKAGKVSLVAIGAHSERPIEIQTGCIVWTRSASGSGVVCSQVCCCRVL